MTAELNHTIIWSTDQERSAAFLADVLNRSAPKRIGRFSVVELDNGVAMDFATPDKEITPQHYAFLVDDDGFDHGMRSIMAHKLPYWADPARTRLNEINHKDGGRGVYFSDPDGHLLELITIPYGGSGLVSPRDRNASARSTSVPKRPIWEKWFREGR